MTSPVPELPEVPLTVTRANRGTVWLARRELETHPSTVALISEGRTTTPVGPVYRNW